MIYIDTSNINVTVSAIAKQVIQDVKTSFNNTSTMTCAGTSSLSMSAARNAGIDIGDINIPIFSAVVETKYPYELYDAIGVSGDPNLSAYPPPNTTNFGSVFPKSPSTSGYTLSGLSTNECLVYSLTNAYLNTIISALPDVYNKDNENDMTAINPIKKGDLVVRSDNHKTYISTGFTSGSTNWQEISANPSYQYTDWRGHTSGIVTATDQVYYKEIDGLIHLWFNISGTPIPFKPLTITRLPKALAFPSICFGGIKIVEDGVITSTGVAVINGSTLTIQKDFSNTPWIGITKRSANGYVCYQSVQT